MKTTLTILTIILSMIVSQGQVKDSTYANYSIYENRASEISFMYPSGWDTTKTKESRNVLFMAQHIGNSPADPNKEILSVTEIIMPMEIDLDSYLKLFSGPLPGAGIISETSEDKLTQAKVTCRVVTQLLTFDGDDDETIMVSGHFRKKHKLFTVRLTYLKDEEEYFSEIFDNIIYSFKFTD